MGKKHERVREKRDLPSNETVSWPKSFVQLTISPKCTLTTVVPNQIYIIPDFFPSNVCNKLITWFEGFTMETTKQPPKKNFAARVNDRLSLNEPLIAGILWTQLRMVLSGENKVFQYSSELEESEFQNPEFKSCIGLNENLRIYRYRKGHYFGSHYDESVKTAKGTTKWTLLIYLTGVSNGEVSGGATVFYVQGSNEKVAISPCKGMALIHKHGDDCMLHEGALVEQGFKWVLRSDLVW